MAELLIEDIDDRLFEALRARAASNGRSITDEVVAIIQQYLVWPHTDVQTAGEAILQLAGTWQDDRSAEEIVRDIRQSRHLSREIENSNS
jgi:ABC-type arginine transport system ATPase subunit